MIIAEAMRFSYQKLIVDRIIFRDWMLFVTMFSSFPKIQFQKERLNQSISCQITFAFKMVKDEMRRKTSEHSCDILPPVSNKNILQPPLMLVGFFLHKPKPDKAQEGVEGLRYEDPLSDHLSFGE